LLISFLRTEEAQRKVIWFRKNSQEDIDNEEAKGNEEDNIASYVGSDWKK